MNLAGTSLSWMSHWARDPGIASSWANPGENNPSHRQHPKNISADEVKRPVKSEMMPKASTTDYEFLFPTYTAMRRPPEKGAVVILNPLAGSSR